MSQRYPPYKELTVPALEVHKRLPRVNVRIIFLSEKETVVFSVPIGLSLRQGKLTHFYAFILFLFYFIILPHTMNYKQNKNDNK